MSSFGTNFRVTTYGESHGKSVGCIIEGVPPNTPMHESDIQPALDRRRPGQSRLTTERSETDQCSILSGVCPFDKVTLGTAMAVSVPNKDQRSFDYASHDDRPRPGHAEYTYQVKYGVRAKSGGGRASARETIARCIAGGVAQKCIQTSLGLPKLNVYSFVSRVGPCLIPQERMTEYLNDATLTPERVYAMGTIYCLFELETGRLLEARRFNLDGDTIDICYPINKSSEIFDPEDRRLPATRFRVECVPKVDATGNHLPEDFEPVYTNCPDMLTSCQIADTISKCRLMKDSVGGVTTTVIHNAPPGMGDPVFDKLEARLAHGILSLPATKGFEFGEGFAAAETFLGSTHNDSFVGASSGGQLVVGSNHAGGTLGGISTGAPIYFRTAFKPVSSIGIPQQSANWNGEMGALAVKGRHDPCVLPRCPPLTDATAWMVLADLILSQKAKGQNQWCSNFCTGKENSSPEQ